MSLHNCDGCGKMRRDVQSVGKDSNGDPDAPDYCFLCRKENARNRHWSAKVKGYVPNHLEDQDIVEVVAIRLNGVVWLGHIK